MCEPTTVLMVVGTLYSGYTQYQQGRNQAAAMKDQAAYERHMGEYNAANQENEATKIRNKGVEEENRRRRVTAELLSRQRAGFGARGVDVNSGSALLIQTDTQDLGEADALQIRANYDDEFDSMTEGAMLTRTGAARSAWQLKNEAKSVKRAGRSALIGSVLSASAMGVSSKWGAAKTPNQIDRALASKHGIAYQ